MCFKSDYKIHNIFENIRSSRKDIKILSGIHPIEPYLENFLERAYPNHPAIQLHYVTHHTTIQAGCFTMPPHYLKNDTPMFEQGFLPFIIKKNIYSGTPPPPSITIGYFNIIPCKRSHKRKIPTTPLARGIYLPMF